MADPYRLQRFVDAQQGVYETVCAELRGGLKRTHWMWFIFPQLAGLGSSSTARLYAISGLAEARGYLAHELLGARLCECTRLANAVPGRTAFEIFGEPDCLKFHSCMTLFARAAVSAPAAPTACVPGDADTAGELPFSAALTRYFDGAGDPRTLQLLQQEGP